MRCNLTLQKLQNRIELSSTDVFSCALLYKESIMDKDKLEAHADLYKSHFVFAVTKRISSLEGHLASPSEEAQTRPEV